MLVFRYENAAGVGPYNTFGWCGRDDMIEAHNNVDRTPGPFYDFPKGTPGHQFAYGCPSLEILKEWFEGFESDLGAAGFIIKVYDVPDDCVSIGKSGKQVAFLKPEAATSMMAIPADQLQVKCVPQPESALDQYNSNADAVVNKILSTNMQRSYKSDYQYQYSPKPMFWADDGEPSEYEYEQELAYEVKRATQEEM